MIPNEEAFRKSGCDTSSETAGGKQRDYWRTFYAEQWRFRQHFIEEKIQGGETNAMRLLGMLEKFERKNAIVQDQIFTTDGVVVTSRIRPQTFSEELTPAGVPAFRESSLRGNVVKVPFHLPDAYVNFLTDVIDESGPFDAILELGCGLGRNLLGIFHAGGPGGIPYLGGELTPCGVDLANRLGGLVPGLNMRAHPFDHLSPDLSFLPQVERLFVFTVHSLEQVREIGQSFFRAIAQAAPKVTVVHLEPFGYQAQILGPATRLQRQHFEQSQWNANLWDALNQAQAEGTIRLTFAALEMFLPADQDNATSIAVWQKP